MSSRKARSSSESSSSSPSSSPPPPAPSSKQSVERAKYVPSDSESSDEEKGRVVKSAKEKALEQVGKAAKELRVCLGSDDWKEIKSSFEGLNKVLGKQQSALGGVVPESYLEAMVVLEEEIDGLAADKEGQKRISQLKYKAFNALKIALPKHLATFRADMQALPEKKVEEKKPASKKRKESMSSSSGSSESSGSSSGSSDSGESSSGSGSDEDGDSSSGSSSSSSSSSGTSEEGSASDGEEVSASSDDDDGSSTSSEYSSSSSSSKSEIEQMEFVNKRDRWVKHTVLKIVPDKAQLSAEAAAAEEKRLKKLKAAEERRQQKIVEERERRAREAAVVLTERDVERLIKATASKMWRRDANRREITDQLRDHVSRSIPFGPKVILAAMLFLISSHFDSRTIDDVMAMDRWRAAVTDLRFVLRLLEKNPELRLAPMPSDEALDVASAAQSESVEQILAEAAGAVQGEQQAILARQKEQAIMDERNKDQDPHVVFAVGDIAVFSSRLATELTKALRSIPPHSSEFLERLKDEPVLLDLVIQVQSYLERIDDSFSASKQALLRVELMYYKHDSIAQPAHVAHYRSEVLGRHWHPATWGMGIAGSQVLTNDGVEEVVNADLVHPSASRVIVVPVPTLDASAVLDSLCTYIYQTGDDNQRVRAMLCQIYHLAMHDQYFKARDMLLMCRLQDSASSLPEAEQILYNRAIAMLGLCAFRAGLLQEAHSCLVDVCGQGRAKELLAQMPTFRHRKEERDMDKENQERRRLIPFHQHIDMDLLESCHLTSAMLLEIPNMALSEKPYYHDERYYSEDYVISRVFRKYLDLYERAVFIGPPENIRDHVLAAGVALREGDWKTSAEHILTLSVWDSVHNSIVVKDMLTKKIKTGAMRVYLLSFAAYYESMRLDALGDLFSLEAGEVKSILANLILAKQIQASWDEGVVRFHKIVPTTLQALSLKFADKARELVDNNDKSNERLTGAGGGRSAGGGEDGGERGERRPNRRFRGGGGGGGGGGGDRPRRDGGNRGGGIAGNSNIVQRGFRSDRSSSAKA